MTSALCGLSVDQAMALARTQGVERRDAQVLLGHILDHDRSWLLSHGEHGLTHQQADRFALHCRQRAAGVPVAYLVGQREFYGMTLQVSPDVLDPRPDTEVLVDWALEVLNSTSEQRPEPQVVDLGTGSGAIALAIKRACPGAQVTAVDRSAAALRVAQCNTRQLILSVCLIHGHWFSAVGDRRYDLIVSNPPYIASTDPHLAALRAEPQEALVAGVDGLEALREIVRDAPCHLRSAGALLLEHGAGQAAAVAQLMQRAGFEHIKHRQDLAGHTRCTGGWWLSAGPSKA